MIKNKKGMLARDYIIILILFGSISLLGYLVVVDFAGTESGYGIDGMVDEDFQSNYDTLTESSSDIYRMRNATASEEGTSIVSTYTTMFRSTFSVISIVLGSVGMTSDTLTFFAEDFEVPSSVANVMFSAILGILITILIFVIVSSVSKGRI